MAFKAFGGMYHQRPGSAGLIEQNRLAVEQMAQIELVTFFHGVTNIYDMRT